MKKKASEAELELEREQTWVEIERLRKGRGAGNSDFVASNPYEAVKKATIEGLQIKAFQKALGPEEQSAGAESQSQGPSQQANDVLAHKARIAEALAKAGKKPEEIAQYLDALGPHMEMAALATDPLAASLLFSRYAANPGNMQMKDVVEIVKLVNEGRPNTAGNGSPVEVANAIVNAVKTGMEMSQAKSNGPSELDVFEKALDFFKNVSSEAEKAKTTLWDERFKRLEERSAPPDILDEVKKAKDVVETLGMGTMDRELTRMKLEHEHAERIEDRKDARAEREHDREQRREILKANQQTKMIDRIAGGIKEALESPVVKEAGKAAGEKLGVKVPDIRGKAAREQLANPMQEQSFLTCTGCGKEHAFTNADLVKIEQSGGRWMCSTPGCGKVYQLKAGGATTT